MWRLIKRALNEIKFKWMSLYAIILPIAAVFIVRKLETRYCFFIELSKGFSNLLSIIATFISVVIGLLGVLLTCLISIRDSSDMVKYFFEEGQGKVFQKGIRNCIRAGLFSLVATYVLMVQDILPVQFFSVVKYIWIVIVVYFSAMVYRFISILLELVMNNEELEGEKKDNQDVTGERQTKMDEGIPKF